MAEIWSEQSRELEELLGLENKVVAVAFTNDEVEDVRGRKAWVCQALKQAAQGESYVLDAETSVCPGGSWHCGLTEPHTGPAKRALQHFLTRGEKLTSSITSFHRMMALTTPPPTGLSDRIVICPMDSSPIRPDLAVVLCNPEAACRLITLDHYWDGIPPKVEVAGALCHSALAYPVVTGKTNVTFGDWTARRMRGYAPDVVFVSIPIERMANLVAAIPVCSAGTAEVEIPTAFRNAMDEG